MHNLCFTSTRGQGLLLGLHSCLSTKEDCIVRFLTYPHSPFLIYKRFWMRLPTALHNLFRAMLTIPCTLTYCLDPLHSTCKPSSAISQSSPRLVVVALLLDLREKPLPMQVLIRCVSIPLDLQYSLYCLTGYPTNICL